jgi:hypothetical protein
LPGVCARSGILSLVTNILASLDCDVPVVLSHWFASKYSSFNVADCVIELTGIPFKIVFFHSEYLALSSPLKNP